jgi:hypothetical protein
LTILPIAPKLITSLFPRGVEWPRVAAMIRASHIF